MGERLGDVEFIVVCDRKTPQFEYIGDRVTVFNCGMQERWIDEFFTNKEEFEFCVPWNSVRRRNFGYLYALQQGAEHIITVDDDNYQERGWLKSHCHELMWDHAVRLVSSVNRIVNPCNMLRFNRDVPIYSRGYPLPQMYRDSFNIDNYNGHGRVVLNLGLWRSSPDVDSYTNLVYPNLRSYGLKGINRLALEKDNYAPLNTQNTSFRAEITPAFYAVLMDSTIYDLKIDRYDDVWAGWFLEKIMHHLGDTLTFGEPISLHLRNKHDYNTDLRAEFLGATLNTIIFDIVQNIQLEGKTYADCYVELADKLAEEILVRLADHEIKRFFMRMCRAMMMWPQLCEAVT